jgi:ubiquitin C-terminal hydrolase
MHGGAPGSRGPKGAHNGNYKHGHYTAEAIASRRWLRAKTREVRALTRSCRHLGDSQISRSVIHGEPS